MSSFQIKNPGHISSLVVSAVENILQYLLKDKEFNTKRIATSFTAHGDEKEINVKAKAFLYFPEKKLDIRIIFFTKVERIENDQWKINSKIALVFEQKLPTDDTIWIHYAGEDPAFADDLSTEIGYYFRNQVI